MSKNIPTKINNYNVYNEGEKLLGVGDELTLPDFEATSETVSGAGILGEIDDPTIGHFGNMQLEIPFRTLDKEATNMMDQTRAVQLTIRGAAQEIDSAGNIVPKSIRVVVRGRAAKLTGGKLKRASTMDSGVTLNILYILIEVNGESVVELDKMNPTYKVNGVGYESGQALLESEGLQGALEALKKSVGGNELAFAGLFSSVEAQTAVLAMAGTQAENLTSKTAEMYEATGAANTAFERQTDTLAYDIQMIKNLGANFLTELGTNILPYVRELAEAALPVVQEALGRIGDYMTGVILPAAETAVKWVSENKDLILALAAGILTAVAAYKAYKLAVTAYNAVMGVYKVVTEASATGTFTLAGAMTALNLPVLAVVAAIAAVVAIGVLLYKNWDAVIAKAAELGAQIAQVFGNIKNWVTTTISNLVAAFQANFPMLSAFITGWWQSIQAAVENVKDIFTNIIEFVKNVFTGNWEGAWDNIVNIFGNLFGMIVNLAKAPINGVISAINWVLEKINSISVTIPDWVPLVGGQTLGFNIPTIPALAAGGIATAPTLAMIGEGGEPEAVMPLSKLAALLDEWNKPKPQGGGDPEDGDGNRIVWSPVFHFYGNTTKEEAVEAARMSFAEFKKMYKQMKAEERRKKFAPA